MDNPLNKIDGSSNPDSPEIVSSSVDVGYFHTHNGTDSPLVSFKNLAAGTGIVITQSNPIIVSTTSSGGVTQLVAGTNVTLTPSSGLGAVTVSATMLDKLPIGRDATSIAGKLSGATSFNISHTCSGTNRVLITAIEGDIVPTDVITGVTYAGSPMTRMTQHINFTASQSFWIYYKLAPAVGTNNIVITTSSDPGAGGGGLYVASASYTGTIQTGFPQAQFDNSNGVTSAQAFVGGTTNPYQWGVVCGGGNANPYTLQAAAGNGAVATIVAQGTRCFIADTNGTVNPAHVFITGIQGNISGVIFDIEMAIDPASA